MNMVSEGVDIPRLRVGVYATAAKTPLIFRQIVGRFVRTIAGPRARAELAVPARRAGPARPRRARSRHELRHALRDRRRSTRASRSRAERRATEPSRAAEFVPLSAEFAPQMTLFGPAPQPRRRAASTRLPAPEPTSRAAAFERRADLRAERSRLVADLHRRDGRSHREINAWLNRAVGVDRVDAARIPQLERSIEALMAELMRSGRRAAAR